MKVRNGVMMVYIEIIHNLKFTYKKKKAKMHFVVPQECIKPLAISTVSILYHHFKIDPDKIINVSLI